MAFKILFPEEILNTIHYAVGQASSVVKRDGIILEKGAIISEKRIEQNRALYEQYCRLWSVYPDLLN